MPETIPVTVDNFGRAESDRAFAGVVQLGGFGKFHHGGLTPIESQPVPRCNRDTFYSIAVFDLDAGAVTITLPDTGERFMSLQAIDEDEYVVKVAYGAGVHRFSNDAVGTRYILAAVRILVDPNDAEDTNKVSKLQNAIKVQQAAAGSFELPHWDPESQKKVRDAFLSLNETVADSKHMFGARDEVDPIRHLIGIAALWGGNPEKDATYLNFKPDKNDGKTVYRVTAKDVPVDGFWSVTVYNAQGYIEANAANAYSLNNITAKKNADGSITIQFGGCGDGTPNCLPIMPGWNYTVRLYRPRPEVLNGAWKFPEPESVH